jgi:hypothetical protein
MYTGFSRSLPMREEDDELVAASRFHGRWSRRGLARALLVHGCASEAWICERGMARLGGAGEAVRGGLVRSEAGPVLGRGLCRAEARRVRAWVSCRVSWWPGVLKRRGGKLAGESWAMALQGRREVQRGRGGRARRWARAGGWARSRASGRRAEQCEGSSDAVGVDLHEMGRESI